MLRGFYTSASGIMMQERALDVLTNNMVNARTPGFRASRVVNTTFEQEFLTRMEKYNTAGIGKGAPISVVSDVPTSFDPNSLEETGRPFDLGINGIGFFNIQVQQGEGDPQTYLTRSGNFDLDPEGYLVLRGKGQVMGEKGPIQLTSSNFRVEENGEIYDEDNKLVDTILITVPTEGAEIEVNENGMYSVENMELNQQVNDQTLLVQGWVERSNVDLNREYTLVMEAQRTLQACSTALQILDKINQKAAQQIAEL
ncbi:MAG: flagellar hook-basal body complex protein [Anaerotruncus sp.]|jgi:flagellar basal-body rod protein FlgF|nr:flagellar hook-basal body complex protein [Anaerotruncus sp.]